MPTTESKTPGQDTLKEIRHQPETWRKTGEIVKTSGRLKPGPAVLTGAGSSYYVGMAVESGWPAGRAVASTELFLDYRDPLAHRGLVVSFARSGNSPESTAVVSKIQQGMPEVRHLAITCNAEGQLANWKGVDAVVLPPETNDRSLVMTSSLTNMIVAGLYVARPAEVEAALPTLCESGEQVLSDYASKAEAIAKEPPRRMVALASAPLLGAAREACLKTLEMTSGKIACLTETYLGLRHGPMSFVEPDTLVLCFLSSDASRRRYEMDLINELRAKGIGRLIGLAPKDADPGAFDEVLTTEASSLPDYLRSPVEIIFPQLLGYHLSLGCGLDPDSPSPGGVINRVVQGVRIYED